MQKQKSTSFPNGSGVDFLFWQWDSTCLQVVEIILLRIGVGFFSLCCQRFFDEKCNHTEGSHCNSGDAQIKNEVVVLLAAKSKGRIVLLLLRQPDDRALIQHRGGSSLFLPGIAAVRSYYRYFPTAAFSSPELWLLGSTVRYSENIL